MATSNPRYSVCITNYNKGERVRTSLECLFHEVDNRFEIVVVDNYSTDGSEEILHEYAKEGKIRLYQEKSTRGRGRQLALERAQGEYVISGIDTDDFVIPGRLSLLTDFYGKKSEGDVLKVQESGIIVGPSDLLRKIGGWRDLMFSENWDVCQRAAKINKFQWTFFRVKDIIEEGRTPPPTLIIKHKTRYKRYRDELALRRRIFKKGESFGIGKSMDYAFAWLSLLGGGRLDSPGDTFDENDPAYFVDSSRWWHRAGQDESREIGWYKQFLNKTPDWNTWD